jgi:hypothetical protein
LIASKFGVFFLGKHFFFFFYFSLAMDLEEGKKAFSNIPIFPFLFYKLLNICWVILLLCRLAYELNLGAYDDNFLIILADFSEILMSMI